MARLRPSIVRNQASRDGAEAAVSVPRCRRRPVTDEETLARIRDLAIPPAWKDVWICTDPRGHLQATGVDAAGRKQYLLPRRLARAARPAEVRRDARLRRGAAATARRVASATSRGEALSRERVLACAVRLLDLGLFRVGGEDYAERERELRAGDAAQGARHAATATPVMFDYPAKSGQRRVQSGGRRRRSCRSSGAEAAPRRRRRAARLPRGPAVARRPSDDVNEYVKERDRRRVLAPRTSAPGTPPCSRRSRWRVPGRRRAPRAETRASARSTRAVKGVAGSSATRRRSARASYIDPRVFDRFDSGWTITVPKRTGDELLANETMRRRVEKAVLDLISEPHESDLVERPLAA